MAREMQRERAVRRLEARRAVLAAAIRANGGTGTAVASARVRVEHAEAVVEAEALLESHRRDFASGG